MITPRLFKRNGSTRAIQTPGQSDTATNGENTPQTSSTEQNTVPPDKPLEKNNNSMYIIIGIAVIAAGGIGYYIKIVKGRKNVPDTDDEYEDNYGHEDEPEEPDSGDVPEDDISEDGGDDE